MTQTTVFTPTQIVLLKMFETNKSERGMDELKKVLYDHYSRRMDEKLDELWESGKLDQKRLDEIAKMDLHRLSHSFISR